MSHKCLPCGFTLVELLVVLAIMVILATVAVQSLDGVQDQTRYEATQRGIQSVEDAVLGPANQRQLDGTLLSTGFVADLGRLPLAASVTVTLPDGSTATYLEPQELWVQPAGVNSFAVLQALATNLPAANAPDADAEVWVPCGWRGPYIRLGAGQTDLRDAWGNPFDLLRNDRTACAAGDAVSIVRSNGGNGAADQAPSTGYNPDLYLNLVTNAFTGATGTLNYPAVSASDRIHAAPTTAPLVITVQNADSSALEGSSAFEVLYFGPDPVTGGIKIVKSVTQTTGATGPSSLTFTLSDTSICAGPRILRAYETASSATVSATTATKKSQVAQLVLTAGGGTSVTLNLK
jgi:prepilin-type N-terminal cleavage/methylation domain-containing protein